jgi:segregation and condensation protein B
VKSLGHKEVPGRPTLYGTTREFLDYFNLKTLNELPTLAEIRDIDQFNPEFTFEQKNEAAAN